MTLQHSDEPRRPRALSYIDEAGPGVENVEPGPSALEPGPSALSLSTLSLPESLARAGRDSRTGFAFQTAHSGIAVARIVLCV